MSDRNDAPSPMTSARPRILQPLLRSDTFASNSVLSNIKNRETQTDWSWIQDMQLIEKIKKEGGELLKEIVDEIRFQSDLEESEQSESEIEAESDLQQEADQKEIVPVANRTQYVDHQSHKSKQKKIKSKKSLIETIGPPKILKYQPETKKSEIRVVSGSSSASLDSEPIENLGQYMKDFNIYINGGQPCEFCANMTKPWPSISNQEIKNPEILYCCNDYQEFVQGLIEYRIEKEQAFAELTDNMINKVKNEKARELVKQRAEMRKIQILLARQRKMEAIANKKQQQEEKQRQENEQKHSRKHKENDKESNKNSKSSHSESQLKSQASSDKDMNKNQTESAQNMRKNSSIQLEQIMNQMRSINYQLSNLKYLQDGWTVRPTSPLLFDDMFADEDDDNEFNLFVPTSVADQSQKQMVMRYYKSGQLCLLLFPDGTGNVFYPSGRVAIAISQASASMHIMYLYSDDDDCTQDMLAFFDPFGNACVNYPRSNATTATIRLILTPFGGIELDHEGAKKKRWQWWNLVSDEHVHAPPFQSYIISLNNHLSVKIINQDKINISFFAQNQTCKFRVGSKIKILKTEQIPSSVKIDPMEFYLKKQKTKIDVLLGKMSDLLSITRLPKLNGSSRDVQNSQLITVRSQTTPESLNSKLIDKSNKTQNNNQSIYFSLNAIASNHQMRNNQLKNGSNKSSKFLTIP